MAGAQAKPARVSGLAAWRWGLRFALDPLPATRQAFDRFGPFVLLTDALPFVRVKRTVTLGVPLVLTVGPALTAEVLSSPEIWRSVSALPGGPRGSAARRMSAGLTRLIGERHAHYRKLALQPLRRGAVEGLAGRMARIAEAEIASWPFDEAIDLWAYARRIVRKFALDLLFGGENEQSRTIADLISVLMERKWAASASALPLNLPFTTYGRIARDATELERRLLEWAAEKRGRPDARDLASLIVNSPDADGRPPDDATLVAQIASFVALSYEGSQSAVTWALLLLSQHRHIETTLREELNDKLGVTSPALEAAAGLPYLDAVVKEAMRMLPPVPLMMRVAEQDTAIAGQALPNGTRLVLNGLLTNRMADLYPDGDVFRPERWSSISPSMFEYPVFGGGPFACPGYWFGSLAVKIALAAIVMRCRVELPPDARVDYRVQPTLRPRGRLAVILRRAGDDKPAASPITGTIRSLVRFP